MALKRVGFADEVISVRELVTDERNNENQRTGQRVIERQMGELRKDYERLSALSPASNK